MQKNIFKKIIISTSLIIFIFSFFALSNESRAEDNYLTISVDKSTIKKLETITATATSNKSIGGEIVSFSLYGANVTCQMPNSPQAQTCSTTLVAPFTLGTFPLNANINIDNVNYDSNSISITINPETDPVILTGGTTNNTETSNQDTDTTYKPLAPLPGLGDTPYDTQTDCALGNYLNIIIKLILGISAVLAMVMITMGGIEYMTSELISSKEAGKETLKNAILGLLIALGAYLILNTINPQLLNICPKLPEAVIVITEPDAGDDSIDPDFAKGKRIYSTDASVSSGVVSAIAKINDGWELVKFTVHTNNKMTIELKKGSSYDYGSVIDIAPGLNGYATTQNALTGDKKTPLGDWKIIGIKYTPNEAQFNKKGSNMGAAFWHLDPMSSGERGIGIHGNKTGTLSSTNGCVRLKNSDILALQPYIKTGLPVSVKQ